MIIRLALTILLMASNSFAIGSIGTIGGFYKAAVASGGCTTCSTGLIQAFILDDGNADLDDWVGSANLTLGTSPAEPTWAGSNLGIVFDGSDDYASFTPAISDWQGGITVAVISSTIPNTSLSTLVGLENSANTDRFFEIGSNQYTAYNRFSLRGGREFSGAEILVETVTTYTSEHWFFGDYDGADTASIYVDGGTARTDSVTEYGTTGMDVARIGCNASGANCAAVTIKKVYIYSRSLTQTERDFIVAGWTPTK